MKYKLIHLDAGVMAESDKAFVLEDLRTHYVKDKNVPSHLLVIVKGDQS